MLKLRKTWDTFTFFRLQSIAAPGGGRGGRDSFLIYIYIASVADAESLLAVPFGLSVWRSVRSMVFYKARTAQGETMMEYKAS